MRAGAAEHASVAEFARITLALLALSAPPDLVEAAHRAAIDEISHAKTCFTLGSRFSGHAVGPGRLEVERAPTLTSIQELASATLRDGCLGESASALELHAMARDEPNPAIAAVLRRMAIEEERHAELAWRILKFCFDRDERGATAETRRFLATLDHTTVADHVVRPCAEALVRSVNEFA